MKLPSGNEKLLSNFREYWLANTDLINELAAKGANPKYVVISCADPRTDMTELLGLKLGDYFAHRPVGAVVRPYSKGTVLAATLELAMAKGAREIILSGHIGCLAMQELIENGKKEEILSYVAVAEEALQRVRDERANDNSAVPDFAKRVTEETVLVSCRNLLTYPSVAKVADEVTIFPWMTDLQRGLITQFNQASKKFETILDATGQPAQTKPVIATAEARL